MPPTYANGHISATGDPIHFMFGSRVGFSWTADRTALRTNPRWRPPPSWILSNGHISATAHYLYSAHRAVIFAIAQLSCLMISVHLTVLPDRPKNRGHFVLRPITLEILNRIWQKSLSLHSEHHAIIYLNQPWKIVAPSGE